MSDKRSQTWGHTILPGIKISNDRLDIADNGHTLQLGLFQEIWPTANYAFRVQCTYPPG